MLVKQNFRPDGLNFNTVISIKTLIQSCVTRRKNCSLFLLENLDRLLNRLPVNCVSSEHLQKTRIEEYKSFQQLSDANKKSCPAIISYNPKTDLPLLVATISYLILFIRNVSAVNWQYLMKTINSKLMTRAASINSLCVN